MALKFSTGLVDALAGGMGVVSDSGITAGNCTLVDGGGGSDTMTDSGSTFITTGGFIVGDYFIITEATTAANSKVYGPLTAVAAGTLTFGTGQVNTGEAVAAGATIYRVQGGSIRDNMRFGVIRIYSGSQPADADTAESGTLLCEITVSDGAFSGGTWTNGLVFDEVSSGVISIPSGDTWQGTNAATGTAGWFRFYDNNYTTGASTTAVRFDGSCGTSGTQMNMSSTSLTSGKTHTVDSFDFTFPTSS